MTAYPRGQQLFYATYVYEYDNAGNVTAKKYYSLTDEGVTPSNLRYTYSFGYSVGNWGDQLTSYNGNAITYDAIGNPLSYYNGASYAEDTWDKRMAPQLN